MKHVYLIGFMGAGKSTVGRLISRELGMPFVDLDERIESADGHRVTEIFDDRGEDAFRALESAALEATVRGPASVVACGGGVVLRDQNRRVMKASGHVIYLQVSADEAVARVGDTTTRPLLSGASGTLAATSLLAARETLYRALSDVTIDTNGRTVEDVADEATSWLREAADR